MFDLFEFHCPKSGGGCGGYIRVPVRTDEDRLVIVKCPKCRHEHQRRIKDGTIVDGGQRHGQVESSDVHMLEPTLAAYSETPQLEHLAKKPFLGDLWGRFGAR